MHCAQTFAHLSSLLIISHKYAIPHVHAPALTHLLSTYPPTFPTWDTCEEYELTCDRLTALCARHAPHLLAMVSFTLQLGMPHLLIPYLDLSHFPISAIICGYTSASPTHATLHLPTAQLAAVLSGKETLQGFVTNFIKASSMYDKYHCWAVMQYHEKVHSHAFPASTCPDHDAGTADGSPGGQRLECIPTK